MITINEMKCSFPARSENESFARTAVCAFAAQLDPSVEELADLRTAVSEDVTNAVVHGYRGIRSGIISMTVRLLPKHIIYVRIADKGCGIENIDLAMTPLYSSAPAEERAGLGFTVMKSFTDALTVRSHPGEGTVVTMRKKLRNEDEDSDRSS